VKAGGCNEFLARSLSLTLSTKSLFRVQSPSASKLTKLDENTGKDRKIHVILLSTLHHPS
jgi:hypothetical protein